MWKQTNFSHLFSFELFNNIIFNYIKNHQNFSHVTISAQFYDEYNLKKASHILFMESIFIRHISLMGNLTKVLKTEVTLFHTYAIWM